MTQIYLADSQGIRKTVSGSLPAKLSIQPSDLFGLLSNLLDNALENADPKKPEVQVKVEIVKSYFSIVVHNTIKAAFLSQNPLLNTTKKEIKAHGYGMKIIRFITEKYNGILDYWEDDTGFTISILLSLHDPEG